MHFLRSEYYTVQIATVACLTSIFDKSWLSCNENEVNCLIVQEFHMDLADKLEIDELSATDGDDIDRKACIASTRLQLYCSIIGRCYALRKEMWFKLVEFCNQKLGLNDGKHFHNQFIMMNLNCIHLFPPNSGKTYEIVEKLCVEVFDSSTTVLLADLIPHLIGLWIDRNYLLINFPAKLSGCRAKNEFYLDHADIITLRIIQYKSEYIPELLQIFEVDSLSKILRTVITTLLQKILHMNIV